MATFKVKNNERGKKTIIRTRTFWIVIMHIWLVLIVPISFGEIHERLKSKGQKVSEHSVIRVAVTAAFASESGVDIYKRITHYLAEKTGCKFEFVTGFSYSTIDAMLEHKEVDFGFVCGFPYVLQREQTPPTIKLVAAPVMKFSHYNNKPKYFSYVIVHKDSKNGSFFDLKGCTYVYNHEISNFGYNMPRARLIELGETDDFFGKVMPSGSHEESIRMVALGMADASAVNSLVLDYEITKNSDFAGKVKIIEKLGPAGIPPLVASVKTDPDVFRIVQKVVLSMNENPQGKALLDDAFIDRFEVVDDSNYHDIRWMKKLSEDTGFREIR